MGRQTQAEAKGRTDYVLRDMDKAYFREQAEQPVEVEDERGADEIKYIRAVAAVSIARATFIFHFHRLDDM